MLQNHFDHINNMRIILSIITILVIFLIILSIIYCCLLIYGRIQSDKLQNKIEDDEIPIGNKSKTPHMLDTTCENKLSLEEKYDSVFEWQVYTGDFGMEQLYYLNNQCDKYDIPMEIMLSIICTESSFRSTAKAPTSSASGYCQITKNTAKFVYENLLKYGKYNINTHEEIMTTNWKLNIELGCRLMYYLYHNSNQSWELAIQKYYGGSPKENIEYLNKINTNMTDLFDMTVSDIKNNRRN